MSPSATARKGLATTTPPRRLPRRICKLLSIEPRTRAARAQQEAALDALDDGHDGYGPVNDPDFVHFGWRSADYADLRADKLAAKVGRLRRRGRLK